MNDQFVLYILARPFLLVGSEEVLATFQKSFTQQLWLDKSIKIYL